MIHWEIIHLSRSLTIEAPVDAYLSAFLQAPFFCPSLEYQITLLISERPGYNREGDSEFR